MSVLHMGKHKVIKQMAKLEFESRLSDSTAHLTMKLLILYSSFFSLDKEIFKDNNYIFLALIFYVMEQKKKMSLLTKQIGYRI